MCSKYLLAFFLLILAVQSVQVSVADNQEYKRPAFSSVVKISGLAVNESVTVSLSWLALEQDLAIYLYKVETNRQSINTVTFPALNCTKIPTSCSVVFNGSIYTPTSGDYWLSVEYKESLAILNNHIGVASLTVKGDLSTRTNSTLLKQTIAIGPYRYHRVYFSTPTQIKIVLPYTNDTQRDIYMSALPAKTGNYIRVFPEDTTNTYKALDELTRETIVGGNNPADDGTAKTVTWIFNVSAQYSWILVDLSLNVANSFPSDATLAPYVFTYKLNYMTEVYSCPNPVEYPDLTGVFRGCANVSDLSKLPCVLYNATTSVCQACYTGYSLKNGQCFQDACPAGQYKKYGQCIAIPAGCDTYNDFSKCTKCSTGYTLNTVGGCDRAPLVCTGRTFFNSATWTCDNVDAKCATWDVNGICLTCLDSSQKVSNGKCVSIVSTCTDQQFVNAKGECVNIDPLCQNFEKIGGACIKCVWGYQYNTTQAKCVKIVCPTRYVPNDYGKCAKVSDLCDSYDAHGVCLACIPTHALQDDGTCLQVEKPNPCPARQYLGDDNNCHQVSEFCEIYTKDGGICTKCVNNYYLMYTGECVLQKQCKSRQVLINNDCHDVSPTCGNYDRTTGKCLNCASQDYELYYGLCIPVQTCGVRQWTDDNKVCHDVSNRCNTYNPSTGECTSCVQGYNYLNGICCVKGQFNVNGQCTDATDATNLVNDDGCAIYVNGVGCQRCNTGFEKVQDETGFYHCISI